MDLFYRPEPEPKPDLIARLIRLAAPTKIPSMRQLSPHRYDSECYEVANAVANQWPHLQQDSGFYVHPDRGPGDHGWNIAPDGTIVDMTAVQHDYDGLASEEGWDEEKAPAPKHPEIIPPDHPFYPRYVSWTRHEVPAQEIAHGMGYHNTQMDKVESCPLCYPQKTASDYYDEHSEEYPDDWFEEDPEVEQWPEPPSQVPKYQPGDEVVIYGGKPGVIVGEPEKFEGDWWYSVKDNETGQTSTGPEHLFTRPESYDQPGVTGIDDWFPKAGSAPTEPPNYRKQVKSNESCGLCKMMFEGKCWGYGNKPVESDMVCDSFAPETKESKVGESYCAYGCGRKATQWINTADEGQPLSNTGMCDKHAKKYQKGKPAPAWTTRQAGEWDEMLSDKPPAQARAFPFIYLPDKGIYWGGPNTGHAPIEIELTGVAHTIPQPAVYGRWYDDDRVEVYDSLPWNEQEKIENLARLNAPDRPSAP